MEETRRTGDMVKDSIWIGGCSEKKGDLFGDGKIRMARSPYICKECVRIFGYGGVTLESTSHFVMCGEIHAGTDSSPFGKV